MPKAFSYLRFSTPEQAKGDSDRRQTELARNYAAQHGLTLDESSYRDLGVSSFRGTNARTGALGQFLAAIDSGAVPLGSLLLVENLDRVSRQDPWDALPVFQQIINAGVTIVTLQDGKSWSREAMRENPMRLFESLFTMVRAHEESETKSRRLKASWAGKRAKAAEKPITSRGPAWLRLGNDRRWEIIEDRAEVVRRIYTLAATGAGENAIAATLNRDGVLTWGDNGRAPAVHWHKSYVSKLLRSRAVIGTLVPFTMMHEGGKLSRQAATPIEGYYPAVVSDALWGAVRTLKESASPLRGRHAALPIQNILGGLARCSSCGRAMTRVTKGSAAKAGIPKLVCTGAKTGAGCDYIGVPLGLIEEAIRADFRTLANGGASGLKGATVIREAIAEVDVTIKKIDRKIEQLFARQDRLGDEQFWDLMLRLTDRKAVASKEQENIRDLARYCASPDVQRNLNALESALVGEVDRTAANVALRQLFDKVVVDPSAGSLAFHWKAGETNLLCFTVPSAHDRLARAARSVGRDKAGRYLARRRDAAA